MSKRKFEVIIETEHVDDYRVNEAEKLFEIIREHMSYLYEENVAFNVKEIKDVSEHISELVLMEE